MRRPRAGHDLVVGGSGMLAGVVRRLWAEGRAVSVVARGQEKLDELASVAPAGRFKPVKVDYADASAFDAGIAEAAASLGPVERTVCWAHGTAPGAPAIAARWTRDLFVHVLGSASLDPGNPGALRAARDRVMDAANPGLEYRAVVLGFATGAAGKGSRWLTHAEICSGVWEALAGREALSVVGTITPWSARP